jgi:membrane protease YdiL (CAAX protease family)
MPPTKRDMAIAVCRVAPAHAIPDQDKRSRFRKRDQEAFRPGRNRLDRPFGIGNGATGSVPVIAGGARHRICVAAPPFSLEERGSMVVGLRNASRPRLSRAASSIYEKRAHRHTRSYREGTPPWGRDIFAGIGLFLLIFPAFMGGSFVSSLLIYGSWDPERNLYLLNVRTLPLWGVVYSFAAWWLISAATEETTYQGYVLPRIEALSGHSWVAVVVVVFWWTMQHCALPLVPDFKYLAFRFVAFLPGVTLLTLIYLRIRRLPPMILAHWPMDLGAVIMTLTLR